MKRMIGIVLLCMAFSAAASPITRVVVFGDSLSDTGNLYEFMRHQLPISPPYFEGRFTNGPVWIEHVVQHYYPDTAKAHLLNYAFGGSGVSEEDEDEADSQEESVFTLRSEIDSYLGSHYDKADANSLFVLWMGANNYIASPDDPERAVQQVNAGIVRQAERLVKQGARHIVLVTIPNLGQTPWAIDFELTESWGDLSLQHNTLLRRNWLALQDKYPDVQWILLEVDRMFELALQFPERYGFNNITGTCYEAAIPTESSMPAGTGHVPQVALLRMLSTVKPTTGADVCAGYLFFDPIHPSAHAHELIGHEAIQLFDSLGLQFDS